MQTRLRPFRALHLRTLFVGLLLALPGFSRADQDVSRETAVSSPAWLRDGVIYEVFPRAFSDAGNFKGVTARLDELNNLGVTILWIMPINPIGEKGRKGALGSPYAVRDYYAIDPDYGTLDDFKQLINSAHQRGMKVLLDIVPNHTAWDSVMMAHPEFYKQDANGKIVPPVPEWSDVAGLNYANPQLRQYMLAMLKHWLKECDLDGFRCDVASMVPTDFWDQARAELTAIKPDIALLAEASKPELMVKAFDIDYSWPLLSSLNNVLLHDAPARDLKSSWEQSRREFPQGALHMRITDDHDEARAVARYGLKGALAASALMCCLDGVPLLYNGMEAGDATESGDPALFEKVPVLWHPKDRPPLRDIYRDLFRLRKQYPAFRNNQVVWLRNSDDAILVTFLRRDERDAFLVVVNLSNRPLAGNVELKDGAEFKIVRIQGMAEPSPAALPRLQLNGFDWRIYHRVLLPGTLSGVDRTMN